MDESRRGEKVSSADRRELLTLVNEGIAAGLSQFASCATIGIEQRTVQRWRLLPVLEDGRRGPVTRSVHSLSAEEKARVLQISSSPEFYDKSPHQIVPWLADRGEYVASESTFYRLLKANEQLAHRGKSNPKKVQRPKELNAKKPNEIYSWDITYLRTSVRGRYFYLYMFLDIFSRKIMGWRVHDRESADFSSALLAEICDKEKISKHQLVLHADNGSPMKGATMLVTMQMLGIIPSFSRPSVSDDNPFSESLFKTLKYCPQYPSKPFESISEATAWLETFVNWYNHEHLHSAIKFVTPNSRHAGEDVIILDKRRAVYADAKRKNPSRWSTQTRNWQRVDIVKLNCLKEKFNSATTTPVRIAS